MKITTAITERVKAAIPSGGLPLREISECSGVHISNVRTVAKMLADAGAIFTTRAGTAHEGKAEIWTFADQGQRDEFAKRWGAEKRAQERARDIARSEQRKIDRAANPTRSLRSLAAERREAERARKRRELADRAAEEKVARQSKQAKLRAETAHAGRLVFKGGTLSPKPKSSAWDDLPSPNLDHIPIQEIECRLVSPFEPAPEEVQPLFSSLRPGQYIAPAPAWVEAAIS